MWEIMYVTKDPAKDPDGNTVIPLTRMNDDKNTYVREDILDADDKVFLYHDAKKPEIKIKLQKVSTIEFKQVF